MASGRDLLRQWKTEAQTSDAKARIEKKGKKTRFQIKPWDDEHSLTSDEEYPEVSMRHASIGVNRIGCWYMHNTLLC